jgi:ribosomal protein S18 acetylase RimI-like enzyme
MSKIVIRDGEPSDHPFVRDTIRMQLISASAYFARVSPQTFGVLIDPMIATHKLFIAQPVDSPADIVGFLLCEPPTDISFVYVRNEMRRGGIATALLNVAGVTRGEVNTPFLTTKLDGQNFPRLADSHGFKIRFRPFIPLEVSAMLYRAANVA